MYEKEVSADFVGHKIVVKNRWAFFLDTIEPGEISLSIDGKVVDLPRRRFWFRMSVPILRGELQIDSRTHKVEVFVRALFSVRIKICVDDQKLAGDL